MATNTQQKPQPSVEQLAQAHAKAHKRLTIIETIGISLLVLFILIGLATWAYYKQTEQVTTEPFSSNAYR